MHLTDTSFLERVWCNGSISLFQSGDPGSIPGARSGRSVFILLFGEWYACDGGDGTTFVLGRAASGVVLCEYI
jgi:hypothetical protein